MKIFSKFFACLSLFYIGCSSAQEPGANAAIIQFLLDDSDRHHFFSTDLVTSGLRLVVEAEVDDVAEDYNNSRSTPIATSGRFSYWVYVANEPSNNDSGLAIRLHQIQRPNSRVEGPYPKTSYTFNNQFGDADHQLRVIDGDPAHTAPSVGVDADGYIHVTGGMHHGPWEYCISTKPNDISDFECLDELDRRLPPYTYITYPRFFNDESGRLYLNYRSRFSLYWYHGTTFGAVAVYNEANKSWSALGGDDYQTGDLLDQLRNPAKKVQETGVYELPLAPGWEGKRPSALKALFYSDSGILHRYYRNPRNAGLSSSDPEQFRVASYAYQAYWHDMKVAPNGRIHVAAMVRRSPVYDANAAESDPSVTYTRSGNIAGQTFTYREREFTVNFDFGVSILYAYSDDGGVTFKAPNGDLMALPLSPERLKSKSGVLKNNFLTKANGGIVTHDANTIETAFGEKVDLAISPTGRPIIAARKNESATDYFSSEAFVWNGRSWEPVASNNRARGSSIGLVSDGGGGLWVFESVNASVDNIPAKPSSAGDKILYSRSGINGPWLEIEAPWRNGNRHDISNASFSNVLRYVDMDIQRAGRSRLISLIPPNE